VTATIEETAPDVVDDAPERFPLSYLESQLVRQTEQRVHDLHQELLGILAKNRGVADGTPIRLGADDEGVAFIEIAKEQ
jgi:hypothetical protein